MELLPAPSLGLQVNKAAAVVGYHQLVTMGILRPHSMRVQDRAGKFALGSRYLLESLHPLWPCWQREDCLQALIEPVPTLQFRASGPAIVKQRTRYAQNFAGGGHLLRRFEAKWCGRASPQKSPPIRRASLVGDGGKAVAPQGLAEY